MTEARYVVAHLAKSLLWYANTLLAGFLPPETCGLRPASMGWIVGLSPIVTALADLGLGHRWRTLSPSADATAVVQALGAPLVCLFFTLFGATALVPVPLRLVWAPVTLTGHHLSAARSAAERAGGDDRNRRASPVAPAGLAERRVERHRADGRAGRGAAVSPAQAIAYPLFTVAGAALLARGAMAAAVCADPATRAPAHAPGCGVVLTTLTEMIAACTVFRAMAPYFGAFAGGGAGMLIWAALASIVGQPLWMLLIGHLPAAGVTIAMAAVNGVAACVLPSPVRTAPLGVAVAGAAIGAGSTGLWLMLWYPLAAHRAVGVTTERLRRLLNRDAVLTGQKAADPQAAPFRLWISNEGTAALGPRPRGGKRPIGS